MTVKEAVAVSVKVSDPNFVLSSLTSNDVIQLEQAFGVFVNIQLSALADAFGFVDSNGLATLDLLPKDVAIDVVKSFGLVKTILALRNNKKIPPEINLVTVLARVMLSKLQNVGDKYSIDYDKFVIEFTLAQSTKPDYDWKGIKKEAGASVRAEIVNQDLAGCFKEPSLPGNPSGALQAIADGKLDAKYKTDSTSDDVLVSFTFKPKKGE